MAKNIRWDALNPIAPNPNLGTTAFDSFNKGVGSFVDSIRGFAQDKRDQNTNSLIEQAMGIQSLADLENGRNTLLAMTEASGNGADKLKALDALAKQEASLYTKQNNINALAKNEREVAREAGLDQDRILRNNPDLIRKTLAADPTALDAVSGFYDSSGLVDMYGRAVSAKETRENRALEREDRLQDRRDRLKQQNFSNNLALEDQNIRTTNLINPNPGTSTETYVDDGKGGTKVVTTTTPSAAETLAAVSGNRSAAGTLDWGKVGNSTNAPAATSGNNSIANAVNANLKSFSKNMAPETAQAIRNLNLRDNGVLSMMIIESGGGGMGTNSGVAVGPMQLHKDYARADAKKYGIQGDPLTNAEANIRTGQAKMQDLSKKFGGNTDAIAIGYNGGENAARVAYNAWQKAGGKGRVADYIPSTFNRTGGGTGKYDVEQMRNHALKYESALNAMNKSKENRTQRTQNPVQTTTGTLANAATPAGGFSLGSGALAKAQQQLGSTLTGNEQSYNSAGRKAGTVANQSALSMFLEDSKIKPGGSAWSSLLNDSQNVFDTLSVNPEFAKLNPLDQKSVLSDVMKYNTNNQGWLLGRNPSAGKLNDRANKHVMGLIDAKVGALDEKNFSALRAAAQGVIDAEAKRKGRAGPLPTLDQAMRLINPTLYNSMRTKDKEVDNPF